MPPPFVQPEEFTGDVTLPAPLVWAAVARIRRYCGWHVTPTTTEALTLDGPGGRLLVLPTLRILDVSDVVNDGAVVDPSDYRRSARAGALELVTGCWTRNLSGVSLSLTHGMDEATEELAQLALHMAARAATSPTGRIREQVGQRQDAPTLVGTNAAGGVVLMEHEKASLDAYRITVR